MTSKNNILRTFLRNFNYWNNGMSFKMTYQALVFINCKYSIPLFFVCFRNVKVNKKMYWQSLLGIMYFKIMHFYVIKSDLEQRNYFYMFMIFNVWLRLKLWKMMNIFKQISWSKMSILLHCDYFLNNKPIRSYCFSEVLSWKGFLTFPLTNVKINMGNHTNQSNSYEN